MLRKIANLGSGLVFARDLLPSVGRNSNAKFSAQKPDGRLDVRSAANQLQEYRIHKAKFQENMTIYIKKTIVYTIDLTCIIAEKAATQEA